MTQNETLLDVVDILTIEHPYRAVFDGRSRWVRRDPLIRQLREAVAASLTGGNGLASSTSRIPFDSDALEQYDRLEDLILARLRDATDEAPHLTPEANLRAWHRHFIATKPTLEDEEFERILWGHWVGVINAKLHPPVVLELIDTHTKLPYDCPKCGGPTSANSKIPAGWFEAVLNSGADGKGGRWYDKEMRVKLTATYRPDGRGGLERSAVECGCCGWRVTGSSGVRGFAWELEESALVEEAR